MIYQKIDSELTSWAMKNNITIITKNRDWEIRSFIIGDSYIFIDYPDDSGVTKIKIYQKKDRKLIQELSVSVVNLCRELELLIKK